MMGLWKFLGGLLWPLVVSAPGPGHRNFPVDRSGGGTPLLLPSDVVGADGELISHFLPSWKQVVLLFSHQGGTREPCDETVLYFGSHMNLCMWKNCIALNTHTDTHMSAGKTETAVWMWWMDCIRVNVLVVILYCSYTRWYHWEKLDGISGLFSNNCM